jgi:hypothetical protein
MEVCLKIRFLIEDENTSILTSYFAYRAILTIISRSRNEYVNVCLVSHSNVVFTHHIYTALSMYCATWCVILYKLLLMLSLNMILSSFFNNTYLRHYVIFTFVVSGTNNQFFSRWLIQVFTLIKCQNEMLKGILHNYLKIVFQLIFKFVYLNSCLVPYATRGTKLWVNDWNVQLNSCSLHVIQNIWNYDYFAIMFSSY